MIKNLHFLLLTVLLAFLFIAGTMNNEGSPGGKTGSPLDGASCTQCHTGSNPLEVNWISTNIPETGWIPGENYTITLNASHGAAQKIGFEITAEDETSKAGTFALNDDSRTQLTNSKRAVTHTFAGNASTDGENSWDLSWKAPENSAGPVTFYAAFNLANGDGTTADDQIAISTLFVPANTSTAVIDYAAKRLSAYPNPATHSVHVTAPDEMQELSVFNVAGHRLQSYNLQNRNALKIDLNGLTPGIYILKARTSEGELVHRIQKQ